MVVIGVVLVVALAVFVSFLLTSIALATANAWIFMGTFSEGWAACWDRWPIVLGWSFIFVVLFGIFRD